MFFCGVEYVDYVVIGGVLFECWGGPIVPQAQAGGRGGFLLYQLRVASVCVSRLDWILD